MNWPMPDTQAVASIGQVIALCKAFKAPDHHRLLPLAGPESKPSRYTQACGVVSLQVHSTGLQRVQHHGADRWQGQREGPEGGAQPLLPGHPAPGCGHRGAWGHWQHLHDTAHATKGGMVSLTSICCILGRRSCWGSWEPTLAFGGGGGPGAGPKGGGLWGNCS